jgi:hypothetical protein
VGWRGPGLAVALMLWGLLRGVPHEDNASRWARGGVGALEWIRAQRDRRDREARPIDAAVFAGLWRSPDGSAWRFAPNEAMRIARSGGAALPAAKRAACTGTYRVAYEERGRDVLVESGVDASPRAGKIWHSMPERVRLPVASVECSQEAWGGQFVLVRDDELWLLEPWMTTDEMRADAFVFRRTADR